VNGQEKKGRGRAGLPIYLCSVRTWMASKHSATVPHGSSNVQSYPAKHDPAVYIFFYGTRCIYPLTTQ
jgi:hypothetical protein